VPLVLDIIMLLNLQFKTGLVWYFDWIDDEFCILLRNVAVLTGNLLLTLWRSLLSPLYRACCSPRQQKEVEGMTRWNTPSSCSSYLAHSTASLPLSSSTWLHPPLIYVLLLELLPNLLFPCVMQLVLLATYSSLTIL
jgi:hypothetical protein